MHEVSLFCGLLNFIFLLQRVSDCFSGMWLHYSWISLPAKSAGLCLVKLLVDQCDDFRLVFKLLFFGVDFQ